MLLSVDEMYLRSIILLLSVLCTVSGQSNLCDQTPVQAKVATPSENNVYQMDIQPAERRGEHYYYTPDQTYVLTIKTASDGYPFRWFMITAEVPEEEITPFDYQSKHIDVGTLKILDTMKSRYSERCANSVENNDNTDKTNIEVHWVSPKHSNKVRIRAMVAQNSEVWYIGNNLTIMLEKSSKQAKDSPPVDAVETCHLCSEARYELTFTGQWSRLKHPQHYPSKPDENGYSHMIGASHASSFTLWQQGAKASDGVQALAVEADSSLLEREVINAMMSRNGTRTLIRGKRRHHPYMSEPSTSLFRVDRFHHQFSIAVSIRPSPDWFLGTSHFELCTKDGWLEEYEMPLYPWDAGVMDGVSYESLITKTQSEDNVERVEVGSFDRNSPFYQINLNDLAPFATLHVKRLDVYPLKNVECSSEGPPEAEAGSNDVEREQEDEPAEPVLAEVKQRPNICSLSEWGEWSDCKAYGRCGVGFQTRTRYYKTYTDREDILQINPPNDACDEATEMLQRQHCFVQCPAS